MAIVLPKFPRRSLPSIPADETDAGVIVRIAQHRDFYLPGEKIEIEYYLTNVPAPRLNAFEISIIWATQGKGTEDLGVHFFRRNSGNTLLNVDWSRPQAFSVELPIAPLSYQGRLIKIQWSVRARAYLDDGSERFTEQPFHLGNLFN